MLMTTEEVADRWRIHPASVRRMAAKGELRSIRVGAKVLRFREEDVEAFECRQTNIDCSASETDGPAPSTETGSASPVVVWSRPTKSPQSEKSMR